MSLYSHKEFQIHIFRQEKSMLLKTTLIVLLQISSGSYSSEVLFPYLTTLETKIDLRQKRQSYLLKQAQAYKGTTYRKGGESFWEGFDCSGLTLQLFQGMDLSLPHSAKLQSQLGKPVKKKHLETGDLIFFAHNDEISHVAMVLTQDKNGTHIVHATSSKGVIFEILEQSNYWTERYKMAKRLF